MQNAIVTNKPISTYAVAAANPVPPAPIVQPAYRPTRPALAPPQTRYGKPTKQDDSKAPPQRRSVPGLGASSKSLRPRTIRPGI